MRVIAGSARGVRLARAPAGTRPLSDRAREGLFSSLGRAVEGARCADPFAGTGAIGIEALSRGAGSCLFADSSPAAIRTIRENLARTRLRGRARVVRSDARRALLGSGARFDLIFLDPPYATNATDLSAVLEAAAARLDHPEGTAVLTRPKRDHTDVIPIHWAVGRLLTYGDTRILICREAT